jgi:C6 transcription factor Pro1
MHLQAASTLSLKFGWDQLKKGPSSHTHKLAIGFFTGLITWYDILSCASTGLKPFSNFDNVDEDVFTQIHFDKLMGCENWLMRLILEIATLNEGKRHLEASGGLSMWELVRRAADIEMRLETGLITSSGHPNGTTPTDVTTSTTSSDASESLIRDITLIFGSAALVYLQVIISGPHPGGTRDSARRVENNGCS